MLTSNNVLLRILARLCQLKTLDAKYGIFADMFLLCERCEMWHF